MHIKGTLFAHKLSVNFLSKWLLPESPVKKITNGLSLIVVQCAVGMYYIVCLSLGGAGKNNQEIKQILSEHSFKDKR